MPGLNRITALFFVPGFFQQTFSCYSIIVQLALRDISATAGIIVLEVEGYSLQMKNKSLKGGDD